MKNRTDIPIFYYTTRHKELRNSNNLPIAIAVIRFVNGQCFHFKVALIDAVFQYELPDRISELPKMFLLYRLRSVSFDLTISFVITSHFKAAGFKADALEFTQVSHSAVSGSHRPSAHYKRTTSIKPVQIFH